MIASASIATDYHIKIWQDVSALSVPEPAARIEPTAESSVPGGQNGLSAPNDGVEAPKVHLEGEMEIDVP